MYSSDDSRSEEHTSELQSLRHLVCRLLLEKKKNIQRRTSNVQHRIRSNLQLALCNRQFQLSISRVMGRKSCFAAAEQGERGMCTSKARAIARRANTPRAKEAKRDISCLSCEPSPTRDSLATRMPANPPCYGKFRRRGRRSRPIRLRRSTRSSASSNFQVTDAPPSRIFLV